MPVCVVHPGSVHTEIARNLPHGIFQLYKLVQPAMYTMMKNLRQGSLNTLYAATCPSIPMGFADMLYIDRLAIRKPNEAGTNPAAARRLWTVSEQLAGTA